MTIPPPLGWLATGRAWFKQQEWDGWFWIFGLAALVLYGLDLGGVPLRDWDEGIVAQVAKEIYQGGGDRWLFPTLGQVPYFNKPPLIHNLIALAYGLWGIDEGTARLPSALLTAASVPLLYGVGKALFPHGLPAIWATWVYLTFLPVVRHGRLAMLDGPMLCFFLAMLGCVLRCRRDVRWSLGVGLCFSLMGLTKGLLALPLGAIALVFLLWDTPRLFTMAGWWWGWLLGATPLLGWYGLQWHHYGFVFLQSHLLEQSLQRLWDTVEQHHGPPWYYLLELLKYGWPWLMFLPQGWQLAWRERCFSWGKLTLVWLGGYLLIISAMGTKLPWYGLPCYPVIALLVGAHLAQWWTTTIRPAELSLGDYPAGLGLTPWLPETPFLQGWQGAIVGGLGCGSAVAAFYYGVVTPIDSPWVMGALLGLMGTMIMTLMLRQRLEGLPLLVWGMYVSLGLFMMSQHWVWELAEAYPVKPVAAMVQKLTPQGQRIYTSDDGDRPSLNFYGDRPVIPLSDCGIQNLWHQDDQPYLLIDAPTLQRLQLTPYHFLGKQEQWQLITRDFKPPSSKTGTENPGEQLLHLDCLPSPPEMGKGEE